MYAHEEDQGNTGDFFKPRIAVVGVGGGGDNTVHRLSSMDIKGAALFAFNLTSPH